MGYKTRHRLVIWMATILSVAIAIYLLIRTITEVYDVNYSYEFRWYALGIVAAIIANGILLYALSRSRVKKMSLYWFMTFVLTTILWLIFLFLMCSSATPEQAAMWQGIGPIAWLFIPLTVFYFVLCYVNDTDTIGTPMTWGLTIISFLALMYVGGATNFLDTHVVTTNANQYWGYESEAKDQDVLIFVLVLFLFIASLVLLIKAYRRVTNVTQKRQVRIFIFGLLQYITCATVFDIILPTVIPYDSPHIKFVPPITFVYTTALAIIIGYGILKYGIFRLSPVSLSNTILQSLSEAVLGVNKDLKVEFSNSGAESIFGRNQDALSGRPISSLFAPEVYEKVKADIDTGKRFVEYDDINVIDAHEKPVPVTLSVGRVFDDRNKLAGYILIAANISELKKKTIELAQEKASVERKVVERTKQLSEVHARLGASINSLSLGFIMTSDKDTILLMNPAAKTIMALFAGEQQLHLSGEWDLKGVAQVFRSGLDIVSNITQSREHSRSLEFKEVQLGERYMHVFMAPITENDDVIGTVILFEDITEDKIITRSKDEFFSIASHELRTPLTSIRGSAELIHDYYKDSITSKDVFKMISDIQTSSSGLIEIVNDFLAMSELEQGKAIIIPEKFDFMKLIHDAVATEEKVKGEKNITAKINSSVKTLEMTTDRNKVHQVVRTFVSNAYKFTDKGTVTIDIKPDDKSVTVKVSDTGKGIKPENQKLLFRKFQQAGSSLLTRDGGGTGLGLYITKLILGVLDGEAKLESTSVGKGSVFSFTLPLMSKTPPAKQTPAAPATTK